MKSKTMENIILYYKFVPIDDPDMVMRWQRELCTRLGLTGRILISPHGINGTLGGKTEDLKLYRRAMSDTKQFKNITGVTPRQYESRIARPPEKNGLKRN